MLANAMFLAIISVMLEMFVVAKNVKIRTYLIHHEMQGLFFSFALSLALGEMFGAHGLIAMMGGICSTVITTIIYKLHLLHYVDRYIEEKERIDMKIKETKNLLIKSIRFWFKVFTAPIRFLNWVKNQIKKMASAASHVRAKLASLTQRAKRAHS